MMMNRLKSSQRGSVPGSLVASQPPAPPRSPIEKSKRTGQATLKEMFSAESLAISQVGQQAAHVPPSKQVYDQPVSKEMHVVTSETSQRVQQQATQSIASSSGQQPLSVSSHDQVRIANKTATEHAIITSSASTRMSAYSTNMATQQQHAMPSNSSQTPVKSSTTVKSTSTAEATQSKRNTSVANTVTAQPQVAKQRANTLTATALTRSPLRHQKASGSTTNSTVSQALVKQPPNSQSSVLASSSVSVSFGQVRNGPQSSSSVAVGTQPSKASTSQPLLQQSQPIMSPTVAQNQPKSSIPNTSVIQTQQNAANMQAANALASQTSPPQQIPVMVGLEYPPTLQQLQTLAMMGVQVPMYNLPLILQNSKQQSVAGGSTSNNAVCSQAAPIRSAAKQSKTANTGGGTVATKGTAQSKSRAQQNITGVSSSAHISPNVAASLGAKGTNPTTQKSNQAPTASIASSNSNNISTPAFGATMAQTTPAKLHTSTEHTKLTASTSEKSANVRQKTQAKSQTPAECTKLATCTSEKIVTGAQKIPPKMHTSVAHTKNSLPTTSTSTQAQEVTYLFTNTNSASTTAPPSSSVRTKTMPVSSNDSPVQNAVNATNATPTSSKTTVPVKNGGRTASKRAAQPMHFSSTPTTSTNTSSLQTVISSPISITKHAPQVSLSAKKSLSFNSSATTNSNNSHSGLQTTPASSRVQSSPISSSKGKLSAKLTKTSNSTLPVSSDRQKPQMNTVQSLLCTVCQLTPRNPLRSQCCGDLYCEPCSRRMDRCHQHRSSQLRFTRDVELFNVIQKQETKCKYAGNGCTWRGRVADQKHHITVCLYNPSSELIVRCSILSMILWRQSIVEILVLYNYANVSKLKFFQQS